jgi:hypothetical protein
MKVAHVPLHRIHVGDRVVSHTGMSGRIGVVYRAGVPSPVAPALDPDVSEPRLLILWGSGKWTLAPHHSLERVEHDVDGPRGDDALLHDAPPAPGPSAGEKARRRLGQGLREVLSGLTATARTLGPAPSSGTDDPPS